MSFVLLAVLGSAIAVSAVLVIYTLVCVVGCEEPTLALRSTQLLYL